MIQKVTKNKTHHEMRMLIHPKMFRVDEHKITETSHHRNPNMHPQQSTNIQ